MCCSVVSNFRAEGFAQMHGLLTMLAVQPWCGCCGDEEPERRVWQTQAAGGCCCCTAHARSCSDMKRHIKLRQECCALRCRGAGVVCCTWYRLGKPAARQTEAATVVSSNGWWLRLPQSPAGVHINCHTAALTGCRWCSCRRWPWTARQVRAEHRTPRPQTCGRRCCSRLCRCHAQSHHPG